MYWPGGGHAGYEGNPSRVPTEGGTVEVLGQYKAQAIVADDSGVYWTTSDAVMQLGRGTSDPLRIAEIESGGGALASDSQAFYWTDGCGAVKLAK